jgi:hypothetical protein
METLLAFAVVFALIGLVLGILSPRLALPWMDTPTRPLVLGVYGTGFVLIFLMVPVFADLDEYGPDAQSATASDAPAAPERSSDPVPLAVRASLSNTELQIVHAGESIWRNCEVELNYGIVRGGYSQSVGTVMPGDTLRGGLASFTRGAERFDPSRYVVERARMTCDTPRGTGLWTAVNR